MLCPFGRTTVCTARHVPTTRVQSPARWNLSNTLNINGFQKQRTRRENRIEVKLDLQLCIILIFLIQYCMNNIKIPSLYSILAIDQSEETDNIV